MHLCLVCGSKGGRTCHMSWSTKELMCTDMQNASLVMHVCQCICVWHCCCFVWCWTHGAASCQFIAKTQLYQGQAHIKTYHMKQLASAALSLKGPIKHKSEMCVKHSNLSVCFVWTIVSYTELRHLCVGMLHVCVFGSSVCISVYVCVQVGNREAKSQNALHPPPPIHPLHPITYQSTKNNLSNMPTTAG